MPAVMADLGPVGALALDVLEEDELKLLADPLEREGAEAAADDDELDGDE